MQKICLLVLIGMCTIYCADMRAQSTQTESENSSKRTLLPEPSGEDESVFYQETENHEVDDGSADIPKTNEMLLLLGNFGTSATDETDLSGDGKVDDEDLMMLKLKIESEVDTE